MFCALVTIVEGPAVTLEVTPTTLEEGGEATVTASVVPVHSGVIQVNVSLDPADTGRVVFRTGATCPAEAGTTPATTTTLNFAASTAAATETRVLCALENDLDEEDLEVDVAGEIDADGTADAATAGVTVGDAVQVTVRDDDLPDVSIAGPELAANGGFLYEHEARAGVDGGRWTVTRKGVLTAALEVSVTVAETGGGDFVLPADEGTQTLTFKAEASPS